MARVAELLDAWAAEFGLPDGERARWRAAGWLHDALRDADPEVLRPRVPPDRQGLPGAVLHGPAAAERLRIDGVDDGEFLRAVACHTIGSHRLRRLGRALYAADFLEPGRDFEPEWRAGLRDRMPHALDDVVREIVQARIRYLVQRGIELLPDTVAFWNALASP